MANEFSRRHFFYGALLAGAVPAGGFGSAPSLPQAGYKSPNEKLNLASIGAGGRAADDINACVNESAKGLTPNFVALTDPDDVSAASMFNRFDKAAKYKDFRKMLDKEEKNIDAVIIAIPDFMHGTAAMWSMERGKHVYVEKPLTHTVWEARQLTEAAAKFGVATQMGNQGYSNNGARIAAEIIWSGEIGNVTEVHAWTNRPIWPQGMTQIPPPGPIPSTLDWDTWIGIGPWHEYPGPVTTEEEGLPPGRAGGRGAAPRNGFYNPFNWRGFFDFGCGSLGDMACHILGAVNMSLMLGSPSSVEVIKQEGKSPFAFPKKSVTVFEFPARHDMPPVKVYWYDAAPGPMYRPDGIPETEPLIGGPGSFGPPPVAGRGGAAGGRVVADPQNNGVVFVGDKGFLTTDTYADNVRLLPQSRHEAYQLPPQVLSRSPGHHADWMRACKGGAPACSNFSIAGPFTEWIVMGVTALHFDGKLEWDAPKMQFTNNAAANKFIKPAIRKGWSFT